MTTENSIILSILLFTASPSFAQIEFSDFLFPLDKASYFGWRGFKEEMPNLYKKAKTITSPDGKSSFLYDTSGAMQLRIDIDAMLNNDKSSRTVIFRFKFQNSNELKLQIITQGKELSLPTIESLRMGNLPFYPENDNETQTEISFYESFKINFLITIKKDPHGNIKADFYAQNGSQHFLSYHEINSQNYREFTYTLLADDLFGPRKTLKVTKFKTDEMVLGTENYFINEQSVTAEEYIETFSDNGDSYSLQDFIFGMWQNAFRQLVQSVRF